MSCEKCMARGGERVLVLLWSRRMAALYTHFGNCSAKRASEPMPQHNLHPKNRQSDGCNVALVALNSYLAAMISHGSVLLA
jgi:hypothetical protein